MARDLTAPAAGRALAGARVVLVLGAHRSGTSMLASVLHDLGLPLGANLLREPRPDNPLGYWEQAEIVALHESLLEQLDRVWNAPRGVLPFPANWWRADGVRPVRERLKALLVREVSAAGGLWGFKDPRTARLLPLWLELLEETGAAPACVLAVRPPREVARSLAGRDLISPRHGELVWLQHNADALRYAGERLVAVAPYEGWFNEGASLASHLARALGLPPSPPQRIEQVIAERVRSELRHHAAPAEAPELPWVAELHSLLLSRAPQAPERARVDALIRQVDAAQAELVAAAGLNQ